MGTGGNFLTSGFSVVLGTSNCNQLNSTGTRITCVTTVASAGVVNVQVRRIILFVGFGVLMLLCAAQYAEAATTRTAVVQSGFTFTAPSIFGAGSTARPSFVVGTIQRFLSACL